MHRLPRFNGPGEGVFVGVFDIHAHGDPAGKAAKTNSALPQHLRDVGGRRFSGHGGTGGDEDFIDMTALHPPSKFLHFQF